MIESVESACTKGHLQELQRFPSFHARVVDVVSELLRERLGPASDYTQSLIDIQSAYINTNHPAFMTSAQSATTAHMSSPKRRQSLPPRVNKSHHHLPSGRATNLIPFP